jgi:hypothetical protein
MIASVGGVTPSVTILWERIPCVSEYDVWRRDSAGRVAYLGRFPMADQAGVARARLIDRSVEPNRSYRYLIRGVATVPGGPGTRTTCTGPAGVLDVET